METPTRSTAQNRTHDELIDGLVNTYRELNHQIRTIDESRLTAGGSDGSVRDVIASMRHDEMLFAQALKERVTGVATPATEAGGDPVTGLESEHDSTAMLISQFGTARATTLTMLKGLDEEGWTKMQDDGMSILDHVQELIENDAAQLERIKQILSRS